MRLLVVLPFLAAAVLGGCSSGTPTIKVAGACTLYAQINNIGYAAAGPVSADRVGPEYARTTRYRECEDVIIAGQPGPEPWKSGDSSFSPGTPLYTSLDHPTGKALVVQWSGEYLLMHTLPHPGSLGAQ